MLSGCSAHKSQPAPSNVNPELIGSWSNDSGCLATFIKQNDKLILESFNNSNSITFNNIDLVSYKESIFSKFHAENTTIYFKGMFTEGVIIVDKYCKEPLHKTDSN